MQMTKQSTLMFPKAQSEKCDMKSMFYISGIENSFIRRLTIIFGSANMYKNVLKTYYSQMSMAQIKQRGFSKVL